MGNTFDVCKNLYLLLSNKIYIYILIICFIMYIITNYIEYFILLNTEYSYKKLFIRFFILTTAIISFVITKDILPNNLFHELVYHIAYYLTSCIFQIILIRKDRIEKSLKKSKKKEIKSKRKEIKKEKKSKKKDN